ncbi:MAG: UDP-N-acetylmuramate dehydrogenase [Candidatus Moranbacteria bacterium]|nr:UDP-N-acetylmuramate dehydrogenase [Candidatus Moranbacteria bacterium]
MYYIKENYSIAPFTTFKIGGKVKYFVNINNLEQIDELFNEIKETKLPVVFLGGGSNVLFSSAGFNGWVLKFEADQLDQNDNVFDVEAGVELSKLVQKSIKEGYKGLEKLTGIPGTLAGAIRGNAGAFGTDIGRYVQEVLYLDFQDGNFGSLNNKDCQFSYRKSFFSDNKNFLILRVRLKLEKDSPQKLKKQVKEISKLRKKMACYKHPSAGSIFKNLPIEKLEKLPIFQGKKNKQLKELIKNYYTEKKLKDQGKKLKDINFIPAGYLIEKVGLRGRTIGRAQISPMHCNVIYNLGNAASSEVIQLISFAKARVRDEFGIKLEEEVVFVG